MTTKLLAIIAITSCAHCNASVDTTHDDTARFLLGGDGTGCADDHQTILSTYGGAKAHQFKVTTGPHPSHDEIIAYLYGGDPVSPPAHDDDDVALFLLGDSWQSSAATPPAGTAIVKDDVALLERSKCLHELTEWAPTPTYATGRWMLQEQKLQEEAAADELAQFLLSGGIAGESADTREMSEILFGGPAPASSPALTPEDVDLVEQHDSYVGPEVDIVELVELVEAADADLAAYMLGGDAPADAGHDAATLAAFLFGGADAEHQPEKTLQKLVEEHESLPVADMVSLLDRAESKDALYMLGGDARTAGAAPRPAPGGWVALVDRVEAADTALARFHLGGDAAKGADSQGVVAVAGPSVAEEDDMTIAYLYDGHAAGAVATVARDILGGAEPAADGDGEAARYLYGSDDSRVEEEQQPQQFTKSGTTSDEELIAHVLGGDAPAWGEEEATILYVLGETAAQPQLAQAPTSSRSRSRSRSRSDALRPVERWTEGLAPAPYTGDEAEDCSDHECISRTLRAMQAELGLGGAGDSDSDEAGVIWGEDMVEYCQWQAEGEDDETDANAKESCNEQTSSNCPTSRRMPPLPSSYSVLRPPSLATCRQVLKPPAQMLKSS